MIFHGSIGAALSFLAGTSDDRIRTLLLNEINGRAMLIPKRLCPVVFKCLLLHCRKSVVLWQNLLDFLPEKNDWINIIRPSKLNHCYCNSGNWNDINSHPLVVYVTSNILYKFRM
jgi:hypothetical protein